MTPLPKRKVLSIALIVCLLTSVSPLYGDGPKTAPEFRDVQPPADVSRKAQLVLHWKDRALQAEAALAAQGVELLAVKVDVREMRVELRRERRLRVLWLGIGVATALLLSFGAAWAWGRIAR